MKYIQQLSNEDIATQKRIEYQSVGIHLVRALKSLRLSMGNSAPCSASCCCCLDREISHYFAEVFIGTMLTHAEGYGNTGLSAEHFSSTMRGGRRFPIKFDHSYVVTKKLLKFMRWEPFVKKGQPSEQG